MMQKVKWKPFISWEISTFQWGSNKGHKPLHLSNKPRIFGQRHALCTAPNSKTSFAKKPWLVQDIQMLWYDWCEIHTPVLQSDWCEIERYIPLCSNDKIHTLMQESDWRKQHTPLLTYIELFFVMKKEKLKNHWIDNAPVTLH